MSQTRNFVTNSKVDRILDRQSNKKKMSEFIRAAVIFYAQSIETAKKSEQP